MFNQKRIRLKAVDGRLKIKDIADLLSQAQKARNLTHELPWFLPNASASFVLTVLVEIGGADPIWSLYKTEGENSEMLWSSRFNDIELLNDVIIFSMPKETNSISPTKPAAIAEATSSESTIKPSLSTTNALDNIQKDLSLDSFLAKRPNVLLGQFLVEAGLLPEPTLEAALQLQEMVREKQLTIEQAGDAVRRAHERGGLVDPGAFTANVKPPTGARVGIPLGEILVAAGLMNASVINAALKLQEKVRQGLSTQDAAVEEFVRTNFGKQEPGPQPNPKQDPIQLLKQAGLITEQDIQAAITVQKKHGGALEKILIAAGKLDEHTFEAAKACNKSLELGQLPMERAIISLHYCQRSRVSFKDALQELGWEKP